MNKTLKIFLILIIAFGILAAALLPLAKVLVWDRAAKDLQFSVKSGEGTREIAQNLKNQKLISSAWIFSAFIYVKHWYLQTGVYHITPSMRLIDIAQIIHEGKV